MKAERDAFWEIYQDHGNRTDYTHAFAGYGWTYETYHPKYSIRLRDGWTGTSMFQNSSITDTIVPIVCEGAVVMNSSFYLSKVKTIRSIQLASGTTFQNTFYGCTDLENISFSGNIESDINLQWSTKLSKDSIENVLSNAWGAYADSVGAPQVTLSEKAVIRAFGSLEAFEAFVAEHRLNDPPHINLVD
jgi:hypothetical protein